MISKVLLIFSCSYIYFLIKNSKYVKKREKSFVFKNGAQFFFIKSLTSKYIQEALKKKAQNRYRIN